MTAQDVQAANVQMDASAMAVAVPVSVVGCVSCGSVEHSQANNLDSRLISVAWAIRRHDRMLVR